SISGLKVNVHESTLFVVCEVPNGAYFAELFGCEIGCLPSTYLGLPLGGRAKSKGIWDPVVDSFRKRLERWKARFLSFGGRVTLLKSVISNLPTYYLSILRVPASVLAKLESIQRRFLWGGSEDKKRIHLVNWDMVKTSIHKGGLGVMDLDSFNRALLGKWMWRYARENKAWWRELMVFKCGEGSSKWQPRWNFTSAGLSVWKWIVKESLTFWKFRFVDSGGGWVDFWEDVWVRGVRLSERFPRVAVASTTYGALLFHLFPSSFRDGWEVPLSWALRGGALEECRRLETYLSQIPSETFSEGPPMVVWPLTSSSIFSVKSLALQLKSYKFPGFDNFPAKMIWNKVVPLKIQGFIWLVYHDRILTLDVLQAKGF
ncbi:Putative ribonuclease H protein At1g65750, partial [Linum perenne]